jgi:serine/arginine repetitive matrix protein 2
MQARKIFLTTYYDPFYADLHLYSVKPSRTIHWYSILDLRGQDQNLDQGSIYSAVWGALDMIWIFISHLETALWSGWNRDIQNATSWPPT